MSTIEDYPIYRVSLAWEQDAPPNRSVSPAQLLPGGRMRNSAGANRMFRNTPRITDLVSEYYEQWWPWYLSQGWAPGGSDLVVTVSFIHRETWCPGWFSHWTFNDGQTDAEVLESFEQYVRRMIAYNREHGSRRNGIWIDKVCLMGAEDRWRWSGVTSGEPNFERTPPPCRCAHCRKAGVIRIIH